MKNNSNISFPIKPNSSANNSNKPFGTTATLSIAKNPSVTNNQFNKLQTASTSSSTPFPKQVVPPINSSNNVIKNAHSSNLASTSSNFVKSASSSSDKFYGKY